MKEKKTNSKTDKDKIFIFEVTMPDYKKVSRVIAVPSSFSLYNLADLIIQSVEFNLDHAFGFFDNENMFKSHRSYELFTDLIEEGQDLEPTGSGSVKKTKLNQVWGKIGDFMIFMFDYGDGWEFKVTLSAIGENISDPVVLKSVGKAPKQYS